MCLNTAGREPSTRELIEAARGCRALFEANLARRVWASKRPHSNQKILPDEAAPLDLLLDWARSDDVRGNMLVDDPARL